MPEHNVITDPNIHEPKGAASATSGQILVADGSGGTSWQEASAVVDPSAFEDSQLLAGESYSNQDMTVVDSPVQVEFGAAQNGPSDPVSIAANGSLTINEAGQYRIKIQLQYGLISGSASTDLFFHFRPTVNGSQSDSSVTSKITASHVDIHQREIFATFSQGDIFRYEVVLDSASDADGSLLTFTPSTSGWDDSPSARIEVHRFEAA